MDITIKFELDNAAYRQEDNSLSREAVCESLDRIAASIMMDLEYGAIVDENGNKVGSWSFAGEL